MTSSLEKPAGAGRWALRLGIGLFVTGAVIYFAAHEFNLHEAWATLARANLCYLALALAVMLANIGLKAWRWRWLYGTEPGCPSGARLLNALMIGQLGNALLPARLGDVARIWAAGAGQAAGMGSALMTVLVEKAIDSFMLLATLAALLPFIVLAPWLKRSQLVLSVGLVGLLAMLALLAANAPLRGRLLALLQRLPLGPARPYLERTLQMVARLQGLRERKVQTRLWASSLAIWLTAGLINQLGFLALHLSLPLAAGYLLAVTELTGNRVAYTPAGIGVYHYVCVLTLALYGVSFEAALGAGILLHLVVYMPIVLGGLAAVWLESLDVRRLLALSP